MHAKPKACLVDGNEPPAGPQLPTPALKGDSRRGNGVGGLLFSLLAGVPAPPNAA